jgi:hypothetical protein
LTINVKIRNSSDRISPVALRVSLHNADTIPDHEIGRLGSIGWRESTVLVGTDGGVQIS